MPENKKNSSAQQEDVGTAPSDEMSAEEQAAFNKIMGEIEGNGDSEQSPGENETGADDGTVTEEDFAAELENVVQQADADHDESGDPDTDSEAGDELDEDQQKAFESIMSQIEGGDDSEQSPGGNETGADDGTVTEEGFSNQLESVVRQADAASETADENGPSETNAETTGAEEEQRVADADFDASLDTGQQEAFESIMAQIEGGSPEEEESEGELEIAVEAQPETKRAATQAVDAGSPESAAQEAKEDIPADIDAILDQVAVEDDDEEKTPPTESTVVETASGPTSTAPDRNTATDGEKKEQLQAGSPSEAKQSAAVPDDPSLITQPADAGVAPQPDIKFKPLPRSDSVDDGPEKMAAALRENGKPASKKGKTITLGAAAVVLILVVLAGDRYWRHQPIERVEPEMVSSETVVPETDTQPEPVPPSTPPAPAQPDQYASDPSSLKSAVDRLGRLRSRLLAKKTEIEELRAYYQAGIDAEIDGIIDLLETTNKDSAAMADPRIGLGLSAIQRRDTYIRKLVRPVDELTWNSQELLYFSRKAELLALMATKTSDIDIDGFVRQSHELIDRHTRALEALNIDDVSVSPLSTEAIWNDITSRLPKKPPKAAADVPKADNDLISDQICNGDDSQKHKLTVLSPKTARCLAQWKGKDLFLNELKELEPEAARQLATWKGDWLGLNGIEELSPESAAHLSRWKGKGLSLNGLSRLSPRVVAILSEWQGDQIELVNVKHMAHWENPKTRLFLSEEMNRKRRSAKD